MIANNLKPRSLPAQLWHIATSPVNRRNRRWLLGCWLIQVGHTITARYGYHATPNVAIATNHETWCMIHYPECGPLHCTCGRKD